MKGTQLMFNTTRDDQQIQCMECGQTFVFSSEDQDYHAQKGYSAPKRCMVCREKRRQDKSSHRERQMYKVTCDACGCETEVPFKPSSDKPVYCRDCYQQKG